MLIGIRISFSVGTFKIVASHNLPAHRLIVTAFWRKKTEKWPTFKELPWLTQWEKKANGIQNSKSATLAQSCLQTYFGSIISLRD